MKKGAFMECARWDADGLLYMSGELRSEAAVKFEQHMEACEYCRGELERYTKEKAAFFSVSVLQEPTSASLDEKVMSSCMKIPRPAAQAGLFVSWVKKGAFAALFLICGFAAGVYLAMNMEKIQAGDVRMAGQAASMSVGIRQSQEISVVSETPPPQSASSLSRDTSKNDSFGRAPVFDARRLGNMKQQGVVPVDFRNK